MATAETSQPSDPELESTAWDLEPLVEGEGEQGVERRLTEALERAQTFAGRYSGKLEGLSGEGLAEAMTELAGIFDLLGGRAPTRRYAFPRTRAIRPPAL